MERMRNVALASLILAACAGCQGSPFGSPFNAVSDADSSEREAAIGNVTVPTTSRQTRLLFGRRGEDGCPLSAGVTPETIGVVPLLLAAAAPLAKEAVAKGVSALGDYLEKTSTETSSPLITLVRSGYMFYVDRSDPMPSDVHASIECITLVRGTFALTPQENLEQWTTADPKKRFNSMSLEKLELYEPPEMLVQLGIQRDDISGNIRLSPEIIYFRDTDARFAGSGKKNLEISLTLFAGGAKPPAKIDESGAVVVLPLEIRGVAIGSDTPPNLLEYDNPWVPTLAPRQEDVKQARATLTRRDLKSKEFSPINIAMTYRETDSPILMTAFLASLVENKSGDINKAIGDIIDKLAE